MLFRKEISFFKCLYFSEYHIQMSLYVSWLRKGPWIKCVRNWRRDGKVIQNVCNCVQGEGVSRLMCTYTLKLSLFIVLEAFLSYYYYSSCFICRNLTIPFFKKRCIRQKLLFFTSEISFYLFLFKFFFANKS